MRRQELAEIEAVLAAAAGVSAAVAVPLDGGISRILAAAVTPASADVDAVWAQAAERLPRYMMPSTLVAIPALPLSPARAQCLRPGHLDQDLVVSADSSRETFRQ